MPRKPAKQPTLEDARLTAAKAALVAAFRDALEEDEELRELEKAQGYEPTQRQLAAHIGVSQSVINQLLTGRPADMQMSTLLKLRKYAGLSMDALLGIAAPTPAPLPSEGDVTRKFRKGEGPR